MDANWATVIKWFNPKHCKNNLFIGLYWCNVRGWKYSVCVHNIEVWKTKALSIFNNRNCFKLFFIKYIYYTFCINIHINTSL